LLSCGQASALASSGFKLIGLGLAFVKGGDLRVDVRQQRLGVAEVTVEINLGEQ